MDEVSKQEKAAVGSNDPSKKFSGKKAKQARARHAVICNMVPGKRMPKRKPLKELYVDGKFTARIGKTNYTCCERSLRRRGRDDRRGEQKQKKHKTDGDRHFTEGRDGCEYYRLCTSGKSQDGGRENQWTRGLHCECYENSSPMKNTSLQDACKNSWCDWTKLAALGSCKNVVFLRTHDA